MLRRNILYMVVRALIYQSKPKGLPVKDFFDPHNVFLSIEDKKEMVKKMERENQW